MCVCGTDGDENLTVKRRPVRWWRVIMSWRKSVALWEFGAMKSSFLKSWIWLYHGSVRTSESPALQIVQQIIFSTLSINIIMEELLKSTLHH